MQKMPVEMLDQDQPRPTVIPNVRTREGVRLRWFHEHLSNLYQLRPAFRNASFRGCAAGKLESARRVRRPLAVGKHRRHPAGIRDRRRAVVFRRLHSGPL